MVKIIQARVNGRGNYDPFKYGGEGDSGPIERGIGEEESQERVGECMSVGSILLYYEKKKKKKKKKPSHTFTPSLGTLLGRRHSSLL